MFQLHAYMHMNYTLYQIEQLDVTPQTADLTEGQNRRPVAHDFCQLILCNSIFQVRNICIFNAFKYINVKEEGVCLLSLTDFFYANSGQD